MLKRKNMFSMRNKPNRNNRNNMQRKNIKMGDTGENVRQVQEMLVDLINVYPSIPKIKIDGIFGENTKGAVKRFQELMGIYETGSVDEFTFNKLKLIYSKKERLVENLRDGDEENGLDESNNVVKIGSKGRYVVELQEYINKVANIYPAIPKLKIDGIFGKNTEDAVITFQRMFNLDQDGIVGEITWRMLYNASLGTVQPNNN